MEIIRVKVDGEFTYSEAGDEFFAAKKAEIEGFDKLPKPAQDAAIESWRNDLSDDDVVRGLDGVVELTENLRLVNKRKSAVEAARKSLIVATLKVSKKEALKEVYEAKQGSAKLDLIAAVREAAGIPYKTLESWATGVVDAEVLAVISERVKLAKVDSSAP
ncbi:MAG TPA: hypothetical protein VLZ31_02665, partial [Microbacteriaceae bacterium]|nr:hypothetical protein [Microbacteriaceae bacterium]